jgi:hypothetical protein
MALSDFLTEGAQIPEGSAITSVTKQTVLPDWYTSYATNMLSGQQAISNQPYTTYQGPRIAGFTPTQQQGFGMTQAAAGSYQNPLNTAIGAATTAAGTKALPSAQPYFDAASSLNPSATAAGDFATARNLTTQGASTSGLALAAPYLGQAGAINATTTASPYITGAVNTATGAANGGGGLAVAQPYLDGANTNTTDVSSYMSPYTDQVVDRIAELGTRNLNENIMPGIEGRYIGVGQLGYGPANGFGTPSGMMTDTARAIRDTSSDILGKQSEALQSGYNTATQTALADQARRTQLASTAGGLGTANQNAQMTAAGIQANAGSTLGNMEQNRQGALTALGSTAGGLGANDATRTLSAGGQMASIGNSAAGLTADQQKFLQSQGVNVGNLTTADASTALSGADRLGGLASLNQSLGLTGANAVTATGDAQQKLNQQNLDVAYQDFLRQQGYPQDQITKMLETFKGVSAGVPSATQEQGIVPSGQPASYAPSTASQIASGLTGAAGLLAAIKAL